MKMMWIIYVLLVDIAFVMLLCGTGKSHEEQAKEERECYTYLLNNKKIEEGV